MAGLIRQGDIELIRNTVRVDEVIGEHVVLKSAGVGSLKGLCPFHDERTPSFTVRPALGRWHCFGCNESGDVYEFVMRMENLAFAEAVQRLADRVGVTITREDGGRIEKNTPEPGSRKRILEANAAAAAYYQKQLFEPQAEAGRIFLAGRGFDPAAAERFGVGFAPQGWDHLLSYLRGQGFRDADLLAAGLMSSGRSGRPYDRFRGRLIWPIRDITGACVGFGARKLFEDDDGPKYLNTAETAVYRKSHVLYGIDLARRAIASQKQVVVVEGYTDVMACHLAGIDTAVATCGTAFGEDHVTTVRRLLNDDSTGSVIFTFDGDAAGRAAARKAFSLDHQFLARTYIAVDDSGHDPCDLRTTGGDTAIVKLLDSRKPLFEFVMRSTLADFDLDTNEGRVLAVRRTAPIVAGIKDSALRPQYARSLAGWIGLPIEDIHTAVRNAQRSRRNPPHGPRRPDDTESTSSAAKLATEAVQDLMTTTDPVIRLECQVLEVMFQVPHLIPEYLIEQLHPRVFTTPSLRDAFEGIRSVTPWPTHISASWADQVMSSVPLVVAPLLSAVGASQIPAAHDQESMTRYARGIVTALLDTQLTRERTDLLAQLRRLEGSDDTERQRSLSTQLADLEKQRRTARESSHW